MGRGGQSNSITLVVYDVNVRIVDLHIYIYTDMSQFHGTNRQLDGTTRMSIFFRFVLGSVFPISRVIDIQIGSENQSEIDGIPLCVDEMTSKSHRHHLLCVYSYSFLMLFYSFLLFFSFFSSCRCGHSPLYDLHQFVCIFVSMCSVSEDAVNSFLFLFVQVMIGRGVVVVFLFFFK